MYVLGHEIHSFYNALFFHEFRLSSIKLVKMVSSCSLLECHGNDRL